MRRIIIFSIALSILVGCGSSCHIKQIKSYNEIRKQIEQVDSSMLVVFDCDETILMPTDPFLLTALQSDPAIQKIKAEFIQHASTKPNPADYSDAISAQVYIKAHYAPVEQSMVDSIKLLVKQGAKVIALTAQETGPMFGGRIPCFANWRYKKLKELGVDFSSSFSEQKITFNGFPDSPRGRPMFYKGILCSSSYPKGEVLAAFLDHSNWRPSKVIFIDDSEEYINSVACAMKKKSIPFQGYIYKAADYKIPEIDQEVLQLQLDYIKQYDKVITDQEARKLLQSAKL